MKRLTLLLAALLACAALTVTALAAGPSLTVNGDGKPSTTNEAEARTYLGAFEPNTGRFLGLASTKSALNRNTALKAKATQIAAISSLRRKVNGRQSRTMTRIPTIPMVTAQMVDIISEGSLNA